MNAPARRFLTISYWVAYGAVYSGWLFHRSGKGTGFPYSPGYLLFLAAAATPFLLPAVLARLAARGVLRNVLLGLIPAGALLTSLYVAAAAVYYHRQEHLFDPFLQMPPPRSESLRQPKGPGTFRILAIGGSTTGGDRLLTEATRYPAALGRILAARYPSVRIEVFNAGQAWYTTRHTLINYVTLYQDWSPDLVVEMDGINDVVRSFSPSGYAVGPYDELYSHYYGPAIAGARPPTFERIAGAALGRVVSKPAAFWFSELLPRYVESDVPLERFRSIGPFERNILKTIRCVRDDGSDMLLVTQPSLYRRDLSPSEKGLLKFGKSFCATRRNALQEEIPSAESLGRAMRAFNDVVRRLAASEQTLLCDAEPAVGKTLSNFVDDVHYTPAGAEELAGAVAGTIVESGLIERRASSPRPALSR